MRKDIYKSNVHEPLSIEPLSCAEKGRGCHLTPTREEEIIAECQRLIRAGVSQMRIGRMLGASKSRTSRWCIKAILLSGDQTLHRFTQIRERTPLQRLWARIDIPHSDECWIWTGSHRTNGYGTPPVRDGDAEPTVHREVYRLLVADIPDGMVIDHKCRNPRCCNPKHLQPATAGENLYFTRLRRAS